MTLTQGMHRRSFIAASMAATAGAAVLGTSALSGAASAESNMTKAATRTVWKLNPDWGYPLGPKGRTSVSSNASRLHAQNKIFTSEAAAIAGKISPCSLAQPYPIQICEADYQELLSHSMDGGISMDMRCEGVPAIMANAGNVCTASAPPADPVPTPTSAPIPTPTSVPTPTPTNGASSALDEAARRRAAAQLAASAPSGALPVTGANSAVGLAAIGAGALALGFVAQRVARETEPQPATVPIDADHQ